MTDLLERLAAAPEEHRDAPLPAFHPGQRIGRFELLREIGRGGFGVVYAALDRELGREVAFKAVRMGGGLALREERLLREAEAAARLSHPNVVTLLDAGRCEQGPYLVLELLRGRTLAERLAAGAVPPTEALGIALEVARGIAHAHAHGVTHRDLTPGNVFLCDDGHVKVLDLGLAHAFGHRKPEGGTSAFMAPEQLRGAPEDERTDVFALGVILHQMLCGKLPFADDAGTASRRPAPRLPPPVEPGARDLVARMLEKDPVDRPRDGGEVVATLRAILDGQAGSRRGPRAPGSARARAGRRSRRAALSGVVLAGALGGLLGWHALRSRVPVAPPPAAAAPGAPARASIAVLPFADLSPGRDQEYLADGIAEEILNALAQVEGLRVPGRTSSFFFKGKSVRLSELGRELNVETVLEGSVRRSGNRVRITAQLVDVRDGFRRWSRELDRELTDVFAVQEEIARAVVEALNASLLPAGPRAAARAVPVNPQAYEQYLLGRHLYVNRFSSPDGFGRAVEAYQRAIAIDPGFAPAWAGLGIPLFYSADVAPTPEAARALRERALAAAERAVALDPDTSDGLSTRGILRALVRHDWRGAQADLERAVSISPGSADASRRYAILLAEFSRLPEAVARARRAVELDPMSMPSWTKLGQTLAMFGALEEAQKALERALELVPDAQYALSSLGDVLLLQGRPQAAAAAFERSTGERDRLRGAALVQHALGRDEASRRALRALEARHPAAGLEIAQVHAWRGEVGPALDWLERSYTSGQPLGEGFAHDPLLRRLRGHPRHTALLRKLNLPE